MADEVFKKIQIKDSLGNNVFPVTKASYVNMADGIDVESKINALVTAGGEPNVLTAVKWNGTALEITNKAVDIYSSVSTFVTEEIGKQIHMNVEVVTALPDTGVEGKIYLIAHTGTGTAAGTGGNYDEYIWTGAVFELIGTTAVDLTGYATETFVTTEIGKKVTDLGLDKLAETYAPIALVGRVEAIEGKVATWDGYAGQISAIDGRVTTVEGKVSTLEGEMNAVEGRLDVVEPKVEKNIEDIAKNAKDIADNKAAADAAIKAINESAEMTSGITAAKVSAYDAHIADGDIHVTAAQKTEWSGKQDAIENVDNIIYKDANGYLIDKAGTKLTNILYFEEIA